MKVIELKNATLPAGVYYIEGDDEYWKEFAVKYFISLVPEENRDFNLHILEKPDKTDAIVEGLETLSMFPSTTVIIVRGGTIKMTPTEFTELVKRADGDRYVLFTDADYLTAANKKGITPITCNKQDTFELRRYILSSMPENAIEYRAVDLLMEYTNRDMLRISKELEKLTAYAYGRTVTEEDVKALVANSVENEVFEFTGAIAAGNNALAMTILDRFIARGVSYGYLLATLVGQYRRMLHGALSKKSNEELAAELGTKEFAIKKARDLTGSGKKLRPVYLKYCTDTLTEAEFAFKSGVMSDETAFKCAVDKLIAAR